MTLRLLEGFETKQVLLTKFDRLYTAAVISMSFPDGRKAGKAVSSSTLILTSKQLVDPDSNTWILGFALRKPDSAVVAGSSTAGFQFQNAAGEQCTLLILNSGAGNYSLALKRGATVIDTTSGSFPFGNKRSWMYFQLKVTIRTGANGVYELRSYDMLNNETVEFSGATVNLAEQAVDGADRIRISCDTDTGAQFAMDDIVLMDSTGAQNNDFMAEPAVVLGALPDADGNQSDWAPSSGSDHFALVDEPATDTTDTGKVTAQVIGDIDLFTYSDFAAIHTSGTVVIGAQVVSTAAMDASGQRTLRVRVREGVDEATGDNFVLNDLTIRSFRQLFDQNPTDVPATWTKATLEATEFGIEIQA